MTSKTRIQQRIVSKTFVQEIEEAKPKEAFRFETPMGHPDPGSLDARLQGPNTPPHAHTVSRNSSIANEDHHAFIPPSANDISEEDVEFHLRVENACKKLARLPRKVAARFARRLPSHVDIDDLIGAGGLGLVCAVRQHIDKPDEDLKRLAEQRIRGAILDYLRSVDHLTRRQRAAVAAVTKTQRRLEQEGKPHDLDTVAKKLGMTSDRAQHIVNHLASVHVTSLDNSDDIRHEALDPSERAAKNELQRRLADCVHVLPERLQELIDLYYGKNLTYKQIGSVMGISRSRICQLHTQALNTLRTRMQDHVRSAS